MTDSSALDMLRSIALDSPDLVSLSDFQSRVHFLNDAGLRMVGLPDLAAAQTRTTGQFFTSVGLVSSDAVIEALRTRGSWQGSSELKHFVTGEPIPVSISSFVVRAADGSSMIASIQRDLRAGQNPEVRIRSALDEAAHLAAEQRAIADISRRALRGTLDEVLEAATHAALTLTGAECSSVVRPTADGDALEPVAYSGSSPRPRRIPSGTRSQPGYTFDVGRPVVCADSEAEDRFGVETMKSRNLRSGVSVPISGDDTLWGVLTVHSTAARKYTSQEVTFLGTVCDVVSAAIKRIDLENRLRHRSVHDPLTGLPDRTLVEDILQRALEHSQSTDGHVAVFLVDFDNFKSINDHFGHDIGDIALVATAHRLLDAVAGHSSAGTENVARLGGDEFIVVCTDVADAAAAEHIARSITAVLRVPLTIEGRMVPLSASVGIALSDNAVPLASLVHRADVAMYRAKSTAPGSYAVYDAADDRQARHHLTMSTDLRAALENGDLTLKYRPVTDTASGIVVSYVALPMWEHRVLGTLDASDFLATAERTGVIDKLGAWILRGACRDAATWLGDDPVTVRVDVVPTQIRLEGFVESVSRALNRAGIPPERLVIAIPEHALVPVEDPRMRVVLRELDDLGVGLLLDNSSGGHSSIRNLQKFPEFEFFQLDSADVDATFREHSVVVLHAVVALIHAIGARVVAGGVDSTEHLAGVAAVGCDLAVGTHSGEPVTAEYIAASMHGSDRSRPASR